MDKDQDGILLTYMHPGEYYLTAIADMDGDFGPSEGDVVNPQLRVNLMPEENKIITISNINVQN